MVLRSAAQWAAVVALENEWRIVGTGTDGMKEGSFAQGCSATCANHADELREALKLEQVTKGEEG